MLPDYPDIKNKLYKLLLRRMSIVQAGYSPLISDVTNRYRFEGDKSIIIRKDGKRIKNTIMEYSQEFSLSVTEIHDITPEELLHKLDNAAIEITSQKINTMLDTVGKSAEKAGNFIETKGKFTISTFFKMLNKVQIDFDQNTKEPILPTLVAGEQTFDTLVKEFPQLDNNPKYRRRFEKIINKKREEWYARESNRELVG
mgnify:CR=1 FL=1